MCLFAIDAHDTRQGWETGTDTNKLFVHCPTVPCHVVITVDLTSACSIDIVVHMQTYLFHITSGVNSRSEDHL